MKRIALILAAMVLLTACTRDNLPPQDESMPEQQPSVGEESSIADDVEPSGNQEDEQPAYEFTQKLAQRIVDGSDGVTLILSAAKDEGDRPIEITVALSSGGDAYLSIPLKDITIVETEGEVSITGGGSDDAVFTQTGFDIIDTVKAVLDQDFSGFGAGTTADGDGDDPIYCETMSIGDENETAFCYDGDGELLYITYAGFTVYLNDYKGSADPVYFYPPVEVASQPEAELAPDQSGEEVGLGEAIQLPLQ